MTVRLPNIRRLFVPDPGYMLFEADLAGADGQVVAWEANDPELKRWLREGVDMHVRHAIEIGGEKLDKNSPDYRRIRQAYKHATHGVHYGAGPMAIARNPAVAWPLEKAINYRENYYRRRPGLREWHERVLLGLQDDRSAVNRFGYRIVYFDRMEGLLPRAVAWIAQSTVAIVCCKGALRLSRECPWAEILLQVHDSLVFQVPMHRADNLEVLKRALEVSVPYPDPLVIPWKLKRSEKSWGDMQEC